MSDNLFGFTYLGFGDADDNAMAHGIDLDGDGIVDEIAFASYGDGVEDMFLSDTDENNFGSHGIDIDGDGIADVFGVDTDGDGIADIFAYDSDDDGINDMFVSQTALDLNDDGNIDTFVTETVVDNDQDEHPDYYSSVEMHDDDGDGVFDHVSVDEDYNGDMIFDSHEEYDDFDHDGEFEWTSGYKNIAGDAAMYEEYEHFDSNTADYDHIIGRPEDTADDWHSQHGPTCAIVSQEMVLDDLLGVDFDEDDLRELAEDNGWYSGNGTSLEDIGKILEYHGLNTEQHTGASYEDLRNSVMESGHAVVGLDCDELWNNDYDDLAPGEGGGHVVDVIGLDESDPDHIKVIINDSGVANGNAVMVPWEDFQDAWGAYGNFMVSIDMD